MSNLKNYKIHDVLLWMGACPIGSAPAKKYKRAWKTAWEKYQGYNKYWLSYELKLKFINWEEDKKQLEKIVDAISKKEKIKIGDKYFQFFPNKIVKITTRFGDEEWFQNGKLHRTDGPAIECSNGHKEYWIEGRLLTEEKFKQRMQ